MQLSYSICEDLIHVMKEEEEKEGRGGEKGAKTQRSKEGKEDEKRKADLATFFFLASWNLL